LFGNRDGDLGQKMKTYRNKY